MAEKKVTSNDAANDKPEKAVPAPVDDAVVSDEQLDEVSGGLNPQPLPPRLLEPGTQQSFIVQVGKFFRR